MLKFVKKKMDIFRQQAEMQKEENNISIIQNGKSSAVLISSAG